MVHEPLVFGHVHIADKMANRYPVQSSFLFHPTANLDTESRAIGNNCTVIGFEWPQSSFMMQLTIVFRLDAGKEEMDSASAFCPAVIIPFVTSDNFTDTIYYRASIRADSGFCSDYL